MSTLIVAPPVRPGDTLAVVAPASPYDDALLRAGIAWLEGRGFRVKADPRIGAKARYTSGSAEERAVVLQQALTDPEVRGVIAARGGFGTVHVLPHLDVSAFAAAPKRVVGCSDLTSLLTFLGRETGVVTYHGPMVAAALGRGPDAATAADFLAVLAGEPSPAWPVPLEPLVAGDAEGALTGGCLSLLNVSLGTPYEFDAAGRILFLEDVNEHPYKLDRMLTQLLLAGKLDDVRAVVFGQMEGCAAPAQADYCLQDVLVDLLRPLGVPVYFGYPSGHGRPDFTLPLGAHAVLRGDRLSFSGPF